MQQKLKANIFSILAFSSMIAICFIGAKMWIGEPAPRVITNSKTIVMPNDSAAQLLRSLAVARAQVEYYKEDAASSRQVSEELKGIITERLAPLFTMSDTLKGLYAALRGGQVTGLAKYDAWRREMLLTLNHVSDVVDDHTRLIQGKTRDTVYLPATMFASSPAIYPSLRPRRFGISLNTGVNYNGDVFRPQLNAGFIYFIK